MRHLQWNWYMTKPINISTKKTFEISDTWFYQKEQILVLSVYRDHVVPQKSVRLSRNVTNLTLIYKIDICRYLETKLLVSRELISRFGMSFLKL